MPASGTRGSWSVVVDDNPARDLVIHDLRAVVTDIQTMAREAVDLPLLRTWIDARVALHEATLQYRLAEQSFSRSERSEVAWQRARTAKERVVALARQVYGEESAVRHESTLASLDRRYAEAVAHGKAKHDLDRNVFRTGDGLWTVGCSCGENIKGSDPAGASALAHEHRASALGGQG